MNFECSNIALSDKQKKIGTFRHNFVGIDVQIYHVDTYSKPLFNLKKPYLFFCFIEKNNQGTDGIAINPTLNLTIEQILASFGSAEIY